MKSEKFFSIDEILSEHGDFIESVLRKNVKDEWEREDIFQEFLLSLIQKPLKNEKKPIKSLVYQTLIHDIIDYKRKGKRYSNNLKTHIDSKGVDDLSDMPSAKIEDVEEASRLLDLMERKLAKTQSQALRLRYVENLSNSEIAEEMNVKSTSVERYLSVGLKKIKKFIKKD